MQNSSFKFFNAEHSAGDSFKVLAVASMIGVAVLAGSVQAKGLGRPCTSAPENQWLPKQELQAKIEALGYNVQKVKMEKGCAEFYIRDNNGGKIELFVDPTNGDIVDQIVGGSKKGGSKK